MLPSRNFAKSLDLTHLSYYTISMDKYKDFPMTPRIMSESEGHGYFTAMVEQIAEFKPDEIIAVARSGFSYAMWVAQTLKLPLGAYWPESEFIVRATEGKRVVFVDDNTVKGETYLTCKEVMDGSDVEWKWAVLFTDWNTPEEIRNEVIQGTRLPYFAEEPMWGSMKMSQGAGVRFRDE